MQCKEAEVFDGIIIDNSRANPQELYRHLAKYGLGAKLPQSIEISKVLGMQLNKNNGSILWKRIPIDFDPYAIKTKRQLFLECGQLTGQLTDER